MDAIVEARSSDAEPLLAILPASERVAVAVTVTPDASSVERDPRLGFEPVRARVDVVPPASAEDVPRALVEALAAGPWDRFVLLVELWESAARGGLPD